MLTLLAALGVGGAIALAWPDERRRLRALLLGSRARASRRRPGLADPRSVRLACAALGLVAGLGVGGPLGFVIGAGLAISLPPALARLESRAQRERREAVLRQSADAIDLLAACLVSGAPVAAAVSAVARAIGPPLRDPLRALVAALDLGADPVAAWRDLGRDPALAPLARAVARSWESGAPLGEVLPGLADDLRRSSRAAAETAARAAGVRAVAPLVACFLPAFLLLGVVPVIASLAMPFLER